MTWSDLLNIFADFLSIKKNNHNKGIHESAVSAEIEPPEIRLGPGKVF